MPVDVGLIVPINVEITVKVVVHINVRLVVKMNAKVNVVQNALDIALADVKAVAHILAADAIILALGIVGKIVHLAVAILV